ncbi:MAG: DUF4340 domain-containing protein, partial [Bdellovibrionales bacterium]|nr:DUF4340 domain-containing protein [Bdellovibrionales bacterium]
MKKGQWILILLMLVFSGYVYFSVFTKKQSENQKKLESKIITTSQGLNKIEVTNKESSFTLEYGDDRWWIIEPILYLVQPVFMERSLT